ncbi:MAG TPA: hypothetical protein DIT07_11660, partial [Sphingobacteriaceae bacterium]|nr:hypothetical protein [Sphingobacteriaceae bacterium]
MTFEEEYNKQPGQNDNNKSSDSEAEKSLPAKVVDDILMDYQQLAETKGTPGTGQHIGPHIGLNGGKSKDDDRGIDISQYA